MKKTVAVLFGGSSSEYEVSCVSGATIAESLSKEKYDVKTVGITKEGAWFLYEGPTEGMRSGEWVRHPSCRRAVLAPDTSVHGLLVESPAGRLETMRLDCVIPAVHGKNAEDGTLQGLLHLSGVPYVGSPTLASACCMDKAVTHTLLASWQIPQAHFLGFYVENYRGAGREKIQRKIDARLGWPIFLKPANAGSSVGISKVKSVDELDDAVALAAQNDAKIVVEEAIVGQEVECAVMGNEHPQASMVGEIAAGAEFYDYDDKYKNGKSELYIPAHLEESVAEELRHTACRAYRLLGCTGLCRVDFFVRNGKEVLLNELNTLPGFTAISMYPKLWEAAGKPLPVLLDDLIALAEQRVYYR